jgi:hypothetical protein
MRYRPAAAEVWRQRSGPARVAVVLTFLVFAAAGTYLIIIGCVQIWERTHWNFLARSREEFKQEYQGAEHKLLRNLLEFKKDVPRAELMGQGFNWSTGLNLTPVSPPNLKFFLTFVIGGLFLVGTWLIFGASLVFSENKNMWGWGWQIPRRSQFGPSLGLTLATLVPILPIGYILLMMSTFSSKHFGTFETPLAVKRDLADVTAALGAWADEHGYQEGDNSAWDVQTVPQGDKLARIEVRHLWRPNVFDRWEMTTHGLQNRTPDIALTLIGSAKSKESVVLLSAKFSNVDQSAIDPAVNSLKRAFDPNLPAEPGEPGLSEETGPIVYLSMALLLAIDVFGLALLTRELLASR